VDWEPGPEPNGITLLQGNQDVIVELYVSNFDPLNLLAVRGTLDCATYASGGSGSLVPIEDQCAPGDFATDFCIGVNDLRPDYLFFGKTSLTVCLTDGPCSTETQQGFLCLADLLLGQEPAVDTGNGRYVATFSVHVPMDSTGLFTLSLDPAQALTHIVIATPDPMELPADNLVPALIRVGNSVPAVSNWGLVVLALLLLTGASLERGRKNAPEYAV